MLSASCGSPVQRSFAAVTATRQLVGHLIRILSHHQSSITPRQPVGPPLAHPDLRLRLTSLAKLSLARRFNCAGWGLSPPFGAFSVTTRRHQMRCTPINPCGTRRPSIRLKAWYSSSLPASLLYLVVHLLPGRHKMMMCALPCRGLYRAASARTAQ